MWTLFYSISGTHKVKPYLELRIRKRKYIAQITEAVEHSLKDVLPLFLSGYASSIFLAGIITLPDSNFRMSGNKDGSFTNALFERM